MHRWVHMRMLEAFTTQATTPGSCPFHSPHDTHCTQPCSPTFVQLAGNFVRVIMHPVERTDIDRFFSNFNGNFADLAPILGWPTQYQRLYSPCTYQSLDTTLYYP